MDDEQALLGDGLGRDLGVLRRLAVGHLAAMALLLVLLHVFGHGSAFRWHGEPGHHEQDLVGAHREVLIDQAGLVAKGAAKRCLRYEARADFARHDNGRRSAPVEAFDEPRYRCVNVVLAEHHV